ncbi:hypothetical protein V2G26_005098 [Clonostachys chloroleuca]
MTASASADEASHGPQHHPYFPPAVVIPHYIPSTTPLLEILAPFAALAALAIIPAVVFARRHTSRAIDQFAAGWFALCAFLHICFEGYYIVNRTNIAGLNTLFAQLWKEYTLSDSRYLTLDVFTVCVETITVLVWGPLSLLAALAIVSRRHALRHTCQIIVCVAHLYGVALYYLTNWAEGVSYSRPEVLYFWVYYVGFNAPWATVPLWLLWDSFTEISRAFAVLHEVGERAKRR